MKHHVLQSVRIRSWGTGFGLALFLLASASVQGCTIFILTDTNQTLFCNNEDSDVPQTRIWFVPSHRHLWLGGKRYGCAFVGYADRWGQGGANTEGLAYDWVAGYKASWKRDPKLKRVWGNPAERMLATCASVEEAVAFFQCHWEPGFSYAKILVADRSGASVIIGATNGQLDIQKMKQSRGFGYGGKVIDKMLAANPAPTLTNAANMLGAASNRWTKYSNVFDLKSGDIFLFRFPEQPEAANLNFIEEMKKGRHVYDIRTVKAQPIHKTK